MSSIVRVIAKFGLVLLVLIAVLCMYISVEQGDWWGIFVFFGFLCLIALFYDMLRIEALKQKNPYGSYPPSKTTTFFIFLLGGSGMTANGVAGLWTGSYWSGSVYLALGLVAISAAIDIFRRHR